MLNISDPLHSLFLGGILYTAILLAHFVNFIFWSRQKQSIYGQLDNPLFCCKNLKMIYYLSGHCSNTWDLGGLAFGSFKRLFSFTIISLQIRYGTTGQSTTFNLSSDNNNLHFSRLSILFCWANFNNWSITHIWESKRFMKCDNCSLMGGYSYRMMMNLFIKYSWWWTLCDTSNPTNKNFRALM
jgi:hypothetical protein